VSAPLLMKALTFLIVIYLETDLVQLVDQSLTLVLRKRATRDQSVDLSNERGDRGLAQTVVSEKL
jgi:hypothetical protein